MTPDDGRAPVVPIYKNDDDQIGYRPTKTGSDVGEKDAAVEAVNEQEQEFVEKSLWNLRQR